jgi:hypothetical protein
MRFHLVTLIVTIGVRALWRIIADAQSLRRNQSQVSKRRFPPYRLPQSAPTASSPHKE